MKSLHERLSCHALASAWKVRSCMRTIGKLPVAATAPARARALSTPPPMPAFFHWFLCCAVSGRARRTRMRLRWMLSSLVIAKKNPPMTIVGITIIEFAEVARDIAITENSINSPSRSRVPSTGRPA